MNTDDLTADAVAFDDKLAAIAAELSRIATTLERIEASRRDVGTRRPWPAKESFETMGVQ